MSRTEIRILQNSFARVFLDRRFLKETPTLRSMRPKSRLKWKCQSLGANSFVHLWQDGIPKAPAEREPDVLRRMRTLVALARRLRKKLAPTTTNIASSRASSALAESEIALVLHDFVRREVLQERDGQFEFNLPIFKLWLVDVGIGQLIADALSEELTDMVLTEENKASVRSEEVVTLANQWPTYRGKHLGTDDIRAWFQQVESLRDQRILFNLLQRTRVFSETLVRERLESAHAIVRPLLPEFVIRKKTDRRQDVIVTYIDGPGKSGRVTHQPTPKQTASLLTAYSVVRTSVSTFSRTQIDMAQLPPWS